MGRHHIPREERLGGKGVSLWLRFREGAMICSVLNISRSGVAFRLGDRALLESTPEIQNGTVLRSSLRLSDSSFALSLRVRRIAAEDLGCSFVFPDDDTKRRLYAALSPRFVVHTITQVSPKSLAPHMLYAYFGADFWFLAFNGPRRFLVANSEVSCTVDDGVVTLEAGNFRRSSETFSSQGLETEVTDLVPWDEDRPQLAETVRWLVAVLDAWTDKPADAVDVTDRLRSHHVDG